MTATATAAHICGKPTQDRPDQACALYVGHPGACWPHEALTEALGVADPPAEVVDVVEVDCDDCGGHGEVCLNPNAPSFAHRLVPCDTCSETGKTEVRA